MKEYPFYHLHFSKSSITHSANKHLMNSVWYLWHLIKHVLQFVIYFPSVASMCYYFIYKLCGIFTCFVSIFLKIRLFNYTQEKKCIGQYFKANEVILLQIIWNRFVFPLTASDKTIGDFIQFLVEFIGYYPSWHCFTKSYTMVLDK